MSQQINLFNPAFEPQRQLLSANGFAGIIGALALVLVVAGVLAQVRVSGLQAESKAGAARLDGAQARLAKASVEFVPRKADPALQVRLGQAQVRLLAMQKVAAIVDRGGLGNTQGYAETFRALARQSGQGLWLTGVSVAGGGADLGVRGRALDPALVPGFIGRLGSEPVMRGKRIGNLSIDNGEPGKPDGSAVKEAKEAKSAAAPAYVDFEFRSAPAVAQESKP